MLIGRVILENKQRGNVKKSWEFKKNSVKQLLLYKKIFKKKLLKYTLDQSNYHVVTIQI